jgi:hypothetical protein
MKEFRVTKKLTKEHIDNYIIPIFNILGYECIIVNDSDKIPKIYRDFENALHVRNVVYLHNDPYNTDLCLYDFWHEIGHAIVADPEEAMGINWIPIFYDKKQDLLSSDTIENYATFASECIMSLLGVDENIIMGLSKYTTGIYRNGNITYKEKENRNCGLVKRCELVSNLFHQNSGRKFQKLKNEIRIYKDNMEVNFSDKKLEENAITFPPKWRRGKDFISDTIKNVEANSLKNEKRKIEYTIDDFDVDSKDESVIFFQ